MDAGNCEVACETNLCNVLNIGKEILGHAISVDVGK